MPYRVEIYIGSDNNSRKICKDYLRKVRDWADTIFPEGYTLLRGEGCYRGTYEDSILINVLSNYDIGLRDQLKELKQKLKQEAIIVARATVDFEIV